MVLIIAETQPSKSISAFSSLDLGRHVLCQGSSAASGSNEHWTELVLHVFLSVSHIRVSLSCARASVLSFSLSLSPSPGPFPPPPSLHIPLPVSRSLSVAPSLPRALALSRALSLTRQALSSVTRALTTKARTQLRKLRALVPSLAAVRTLVCEQRSKFVSHTHTRNPFICAAPRVRAKKNRSP